MMSHTDMDDLLINADDDDINFLEITENPQRGEKVRKTNHEVSSVINKGRKIHKLKVKKVRKTRRHEVSSVLKDQKIQELQDNLRKLENQYKKSRNHNNSLSEKLKRKDRERVTLQTQHNGQLRKRREIEETLQKENKKISDEKRKWEQKYKDEVVLNHTSTQKISKLQSEKTSLQTQLDCANVSLQSKETRIEELLKEVTELEMKNVQLEADKKKESKDKDYYFRKARKEKEARNTTNLECSVLSSSSAHVNESIDSTPHLQTSETQALLVQDIQTCYEKNMGLIQTRMREITRNTNKPHKNISPQKMLNFVNGLQNCTKQERKFYDSDVAPKLSWIRSLLSGKRDSILIAFIDLVLDLKM